MGDRFVNRIVLLLLIAYTGACRDSPDRRALRDTILRLGADVNQASNLHDIGKLGKLLLHAPGLVVVGDGSVVEGGDNVIAAQQDYWRGIRSSEVWQRLPEGWKLAYVHESTSP